jgi:hypothetical protein
MVADSPEMLLQSLTRCEIGVHTDPDMKTLQFALVLLIE